MAHPLRPIPLLASLLLAAAPALAAPRLPDFDVLAQAPAHPSRSAAALASAAAAQPLLKPGAPLHLEERLGLPTFAWAAPQPASARAALRPLQPAQAAREHLAAFARLYSLSPQAVAAAEVREVHDTGEGGVIVRFGQRVQGVPVFRSELKVLLDRQNQVIALAGNISPEAEAAAASSLAFRLGGKEAIARAARDLRGVELAGGDLGDLQPGADESLRAAPSPSLADRTGLRLRRPARVRRVLFQLPEGLEPAWYVELEAAGRGTRAPDYYAWVFSAADGRMLFRKDLVAFDQFSYRVFADPATYYPYDSPQGNTPSPKPVAAPDGYQPGFVSSNLVKLQNFPFSKNDPWLAPGAAATQGNNVDAYADLNAPDGFDALDFRADATAAGVFDRTYDPARPPDASTDQQKASITNLFYLNNLLHDWFYDSGFDEAAGNAQKSNLGRGGKENDVLHAEAQDYSGTDNSNMATPADGDSPRQQMYVFVVSRHKLEVTAPAAIAGALAFGGAQFGPQLYDVSGQLVQAKDAGGGTDACNPVADASALAGKIALVDRGTCTFVSKAQTVQAAGAIAMVVVNNDVGLLTMAGTDPVDIPSVIVTQDDGTRIKAQLANGVSVHLLSKALVNRDGALDAQVVAHEWGHYLSNRLIGDGSGISTHQAVGVGEGGSDVIALIATVRAEDAAVPSNAGWSGVYPIGAYASLAFTDDTFYYGIRRYPYSTDMSKNPLTLKHIQDGVALPPASVAPISPFYTNPDGSFDPSNNSEVHFTGEVWAAMVWECYASLLKNRVDTAQLTFDQARDRMRKYVVAAYKLTPYAPTFLEERDALLAAALAGDPIDYALFVRAFAKRGAGTRAVGPDRYSLDHVGVTESYEGGADVKLVSAVLDDSTTALCGANGVLDAGETGKLAVTIQNVGAAALSGATATVTAPGVTFPSGTTLSFGVVQPGKLATATLPASLAAGVTGAQAVTITLAFADAAMTAPIQLAAHERLNTDELQGQTATDDVECAQSPWTVTSSTDTDPVSFATGKWRRVEIAPGDHRWMAPEFDVGADQQLVSPPLSVAQGATLKLKFTHRFNLSTFDSSGTLLYVDAGVVELSADGGKTWTDIGFKAVPAYNGKASKVGGPLDNRSAFVAASDGWPASRIAETIDLGTAWAGSSVLIRFRVVTLGLPGWGWELDDIAVEGLTNLPFCKVVGRSGGCNALPIARATGPATAAEGTAVELDGSASSDPGGAPLAFQWSQIGGPAAALTGATAAKASFTPGGLHDNASYVFALSVNNGKASSLPATVTVQVPHANRPPVADAGADQTVDAGAAVTLDGSKSSDPDDDTLVYAWTQVSGPAAVLDDAHAQKPKLTAPAAGSALVYQLVVNDGRQDSPAVKVNVSVRKGGCGCAAAGGGWSAPLWPLVVLLLAWPRRRHPARRARGSA